VKTHILESTEQGFTCTSCGWTWNREPTDSCPGVRQYRWGEASSLLTKTQLNKSGYQTGKTLPAPSGVLWWQKERTWLWLYDPALATPKRPVSEKQKTALEKAQAGAAAARCCVRCDAWLRHPGKDQLCDDCWERQRASEKAACLLDRDDLVIMDTETTGLHAPEIIEMAIIRADGTPILNTRIRALYPDDMLKPGEHGVCASDIHGIKPEDLINAPGFEEVYPAIVEALRDKHVVVYNADFDLPWLQVHCDRYGLPHVQIKEATCAMELYARYVGDIRWERERRGMYKTYRWQRLPGGDHSALGDCLACLAVLKEMAGDRAIATANSPDCA